MITDGNLELTSTWDAHVGSDIGGVTPTSYGWRDHPLDPLVREFYVQGPKYSDWLAACHRPILPSTGSLALAFDLYVDGDTASCAQALEFDTKLAIGGKMFNWSSQFNYATGIWQISGVDGAWVNTGIHFSKFQPDVRYPIQFNYEFDLAAGTYSFLSVTGGIFYEGGTPPPAILAQPSTWTDTCNLQVQQDLNANGGQFSIYLRNIRYIWQ